MIGSPLVSGGIELWMGRKKEEDQSGFVIGNTFEGKPYRLTERNLGYHIEMVAPSGSGKSNQIKGLIADRIRKGHGLIFLDYKAEFEMISWVFRAAKSANRESDVRLLSLSDREFSVPYNPIKDGDATEIQSSLMNAMTWSEQYYRSIASTTLTTVIKALCAYRDQTGECFHIGHIYELLDQPGLLRGLADRLRELEIPGNAKVVEKLEVLASKLDKPAEKEKITGLMANLDQLLSSSAGELLSTDVIHGSYSILEAVLDGRITVMLMNSLKLKESARVVGKTIVQDLIRYVGTHYSNIEQKKVRPITVIIDEFASCAIPEFIEFMDRARGAGIGIVIAHQARADLREVSPEFQSRIETNSNTTIVSGVKDPADAEYYAGMLGTRTVVKETTQKRDGLFGDESTGVKSTREAEEFILHPNRLKELNQGQVFVISRTTDPQWGLVNVFKAPEFEEFQVTNSDLIQHLKTVRRSYLAQENIHYLDLSTLRIRTEAENREDQSSASQISVAEAWN
jgi:type IV secretory pathway TraG/TraD family ATPase VirD4